MTTLSTHDTKRSEDVRARIIELTEAPQDFGELVRRVNAQVPAPDPATGLFLFQNIIGVWPLDGQVPDTLRQRIHDYAVKAVREASLRTTWFDPDEAFERSVIDWIDALIDGPVASMITAFIQPIHRGALLISLGRKMLQLIGPGVPDTYQGQEFLDDSLVDPDNRRFVDYTSRSQSLEQLCEGVDWRKEADQARAAAEQAGEPDLDLRPYLHVEANPDRAKQHVVHEALQVRKLLSGLFVDGTHQAVYAEGPLDRHLIGLARGFADSPGTEGLTVIALATRRPLDLALRGGWLDTTVTLPAGTWTDRLTGQTFEGTVPVSEVLNLFPTALLVSDRIEASYV